MIKKMKKNQNVKPNLSLEEALEILDIDKKLKSSYANEKRGAIFTINQYLKMRNSMVLALVNIYETCQCKLYVYTSRTIVMEEPIMVLQSIHKNNDKINVRFGTPSQIEQILNTYRNKEKLL